MEELEEFEEDEGQEGAQKPGDAEAAKLGGNDLGGAPLEGRAPTLVRPLPAPENWDLVWNQRSGRACWAVNARLAPAFASTGSEKWALMNVAFIDRHIQAGQPLTLTTFVGVGLCSRAT